ncbi:MAG: hypothetical protein HKN10_06680 [Myxococcales bacterium]|nr:hypothetical protein [Myxococcales bacterium]
MRLGLWAGAAATGAIGWSGRFEHLPIAALVLVLWRWSRSRLEALGVGAAYYGAASVGWIPASSRFFGSESGPSRTAILIWLGAAALLALPWGFLWSEQFAVSAVSRLVRGAALGLVLMVPPLGLVSWSNPWVAGAALLPGLGCFGFGLLTLSVFAPGARSWPGWLAVFFVVSAVACARHEPVAHRDWVGVSTRYGRLTEVGVEARYDRAISSGQVAARTGAKVVLFPEGGGGRWTPSGAALWEAQAAESGRVLFVGALQAREGVRRNGLGIAGEGEAGFWPQRLPAPLGMWAPWRPEHVRSDLFGSSVADILGHRVAMLVCFEQFVSWPALQSAVEGAEIVFAPANLWFARGTNLSAVRDVTLQSWAALMGWSVVEAING